MKSREFVILVAAVGAACQGGGSDIGPRLVPLPSSSSKVDVLDGQSRAVCGAVVTIAGSNARAVTGRGGRGDLFYGPRGRTIVTIDGTNAAAVDADRLATLAVAVTTSGGDLPYAFHLPDLAASVVLSLATGTQAGAQMLTDPVATLTIASGSSVGISTSAANVDLRVASLPREFLPGDLPADADYLFSDGVFVDPPDATFTSADLAWTDAEVGAGSVSLFRLDPATGEWTALGIGTAAVGGAFTATGIPGGGLYVFGRSVASGSVGSVHGRVIDLAGHGLGSARVTVDGRRVNSGDDGSFTVTGVPAVDGSSAARTVTVEVVAGASWLSAAATTTVVMNGAGVADAGDLTLDTTPGGTVRVQQVRRARFEAGHAARLSSLYGSVACTAVTDAEGQASFDDVPSRWFGFLLGFPRDHNLANYAHAVGYYDGGLRWIDVYQYYDDAGWSVGSRSTRVQVCDAVGGGPVYDVAVVRGRVDGEGFTGWTRENGLVSASRLVDGRASALFRSERLGAVIVSGFSIERPDADHLEMPVRQVLRAPFGAFDRHGSVRGGNIIATSGHELRIRSTRRIELDEWWDDVVEGEPIRSSLPIDVDPDVARDSYRCGVDAAGGNIAIAEVTTVGAVTTLERIAFAHDVHATEGATTVLDLPLDRDANAPYVATGVLNDLDAGIAVGDLQYDLAFETPAGLGVDVVRGIGGNLVQSGVDATLLVPSLLGLDDGSAWHVLLHGSGTNGGRTLRQCARQVIPVTGAASYQALLSVPIVTAPTPLSTPNRTGLTIEFTLPAGATYGKITLRSDDAGETAIWDALVPPDATSFRFQTLAQDVADPLVAGRTYHVTVSAYRIAGGPLVASSDPYRDLTAYYFSIGAIERGVVACSSNSFDVTLQ